VEKRLSRSLGAGAVVLLLAGIAAVVRARSAPPATTGSPSADPATAVTTASEALPPATSFASTPPARASAPPSAEAPLDESSLMARMRDARGRDPALVLRLARDGNARFPESTDAPERAAAIVHALAELDRPMEARGAAEAMVNSYPDSNWVREVEQFTGAHRHRNLHLTADGAIEAY
jgi:hypothetical protein